MTERPVAPATTGHATAGLLLKALKLPCLSPDEERELALRSAAGDTAAADRLVQTHLRLVFKVARSYHRFGLPANDLIQEGTIGLIQAVRKFNPDRDARLGTYAMWWVRAAMQDYVVRSWSLVRVGKTAAHRALFFSMKRMAAELRTGVDALSDEVLAKLASRFDLPRAEVTGFASRIARHDQSLDMPVAEDPDSDSMLDRLSCDGPTPEEIAADRGTARLWNTMIDKALAMLPAREAAIIRYRHLSEAAPTFEAIGRDLGISKDRVRQLEKRALERLREVLRPLAVAHGLPGA
jgi:RNA polymerase sigma-32 factor